MRPLTPDAWITSDHHFGHANMLHHEPCRQTAVWAQNCSLDELMVWEWQQLVEPGDLVLHLGDFAWSNTHEWTERVPGEKWIVQGNHDSKCSVLKGYGWSFCAQEYVLLDVAGDDEGDAGTRPRVLGDPGVRGGGCLIARVGDTTIMFSHIAIDDDGEYEGRYTTVRRDLNRLYDEYGCCVNLHGHTHSRTISSRRCVNVCVEQTSFAPLRLRDVLACHCDATP